MPPNRERRDAALQFCSADNPCIFLGAREYQEDATEYKEKRQEYKEDKRVGFVLW